MQLLVKLLRKNLSTGQLLGFFIANLIGGVIILLGLQTYRDFNALMYGDTATSIGNYIVISKPVTTLNTIGNLFGASAPSFNKRDIEELQNHPCVDDVGAFSVASFNVRAHFILGSLNIGTDMFMESVPSNFIDVDFEKDDIDWSADINKKFLPIIIPRSYLNIYNFGFAATKGTPQLATGMISAIPIEIRIRDNQGVRHDYTARVVGFTDRLNTILVPDGFIQQANEAYAPDKEVSNPSRLIVSAKSSADSKKLLKYFESKHYFIEGNSDAVRMKAFVYGVLLIVISIGVIISVLAFLLLMISIMLLIEKNKDKFINLYSMGFTVRIISQPYILLVLMLNVAVWAFSSIVVTVVYPYIFSVMQLLAPDYEPLSILWAWLFALLLGGAFFLLHRSVIVRQITRTTQPH